jgi:hypothetical protein
MSIYIDSGTMKLHLLSVGMTD